MLSRCAAALKRLLVDPLQQLILLIHNVTRPFLLVPRHFFRNTIADSPPPYLLFSLEHTNNPSIPVQPRRKWLV